MKYYGFTFHLIITILLYCKVYASRHSEDISSVNKNNVIFFLYTRQNTLEPIQLRETNLNQLDASKETKFVIHGYFENSGRAWYRDMTTEFLKKGDYNVVQVDWSKPASSSYSVSASNTQPVGEIIGSLITTIHKNYGLPLDNVHIIGHSLGAQVAGYTGKEVIKQAKSPVGRITALDAAGPLFEAPVVLMEGLNKKDAAIVDAIHTDGGIFGRRDPIGTVDFYPNGGFRPQPGCSLGAINIPLWNYVEMLQDVFCSHIKSHQYYINSINKENFTSVKCDSWDSFIRGRCRDGTRTTMGENYDNALKATGLFFLRTNAKSPYAKHV